MLSLRGLATANSLVPSSAVTEQGVSINLQRSNSDVVPPKVQTKKNKSKRQMPNRP